jgi:hypothetical protein
MHGAYGRCVGQERCIWDFVGETSWKKTTWESLGLYRMIILEWSFKK